MLAAALRDLEPLDGGGDSHLDLDGARGPQHSDGHVGSGGGGVVRVVGAGHRVFDGDGGALGFGVGGDGDRLGRVPVVLGEGQGVVVVNAGQRQDGTLMAGQGYRNVPRRQGSQDHRVGVAAAGLDGDGRGADDHPEGLVVVHRHRHVRGAYISVAAPADAVDHRGGVVERVAVLHRRHRHRLGLVPVLRGEGQAPRSGRHLGVVRGVVDRHRHVPAGLVAQDNGVGVAAALRDSELQVRHRHPKLQDGGVRRHGDHGHYHIVRIERGVLRVIGAAHPVGQGDLPGVGILGGPDRHLLLHVPVPGAEGQRVCGAQPGQLQVRAGLARHRDRHVPRWQGPQDHRVGVAAAGLDGDGRRADDHPESLVVGHRHRHVRGAYISVAAGGASR